MSSLLLTPEANISLAASVTNSVTGSFAGPIVVLGRLTDGSCLNLKQD